jgi:hypothetical protein
MHGFEPYKVALHNSGEADPIADSPSALDLN